MRRVLPMLALGLSACSAQAVTTAPAPATLPEDAWLGAQVESLDDNLRRVHVSMVAAATTDALSDYAACAIAGYSVAEGFAFARHILTTYAEEGGIHRADAVYTVSEGYAAGTKKIDAEVTLADCQDRGIPAL